MRAQMVILLLVTGLLAGWVGPEQRSGSAARQGAALPAGVFVAQYAERSGDVGGGRGVFLSLFEQGTGRRLRDLIHVAGRGGMQLAGYSRDGGGDVWYAVARGPRLRSGVANGDPAPGSCGGQIIRIDHATGRSTVVLTVPPDWTVSSPVLSPTGRLLAYLSQRCTQTYGETVVIYDLLSRGQRQLGVSGAVAYRPSWNLDGTRLMFDVFFPYRTASQVDGFVVVGADAAGQIPAAEVLPAPDTACVALTSTFDRAGVALLEGCPDAVTPPARLVQLDPSGRHPLWRAVTGLCPNGATVVSDRTGDRLLITATTTCGGPDNPVDVVQAWTGQHSEELGRYHNPAQFVHAAAW